MDVMFFEAFKEEEIALKKFMPSHIQAGFDARTIQDCRLTAMPASLISIRTQSRIPFEWVSQLKGILSRSQGYDHLLSYCQEVQRDIPCGYLNNYCSRAVAEHAILAMMTLLRRLKSQIKSFDQFHRDDLTGLECRNRNVLVVGVGNIGTEIADLAKGLRMNVKGVDIDPGNKNISYVSLFEGVQWAEIIFCAAPLTAQTNQMLNYKLFQNTGQGKFLINISRGEITPIADLEKLLKDGILAGMSLDVFPDEKGLADFLRSSMKEKNDDLNILLNLSKQDNVLFTPHNAFNTEESVMNKARLSVEAITHFLQNNTFPASVL